MAKSEGATCVPGGATHDGPGGQFVQPTSITGVDNTMRIAQEEMFGLVLSVIPFDKEEDAVRIGNDVNFGMAAGVWTTDIGRAMRMSERLKVGTVWVNTYRVVSFMSPFGGTKRSEIGRESGAEAIKEYVPTQSDWIAQETSVANPFVMR